MDHDTEPIFPSEVLHAIVGGSSALDLPRLYLSDLLDAERFLAAYGFEWQISAQRAELDEIRRRAMALIAEELLIAGQRILDAVSAETDVRRLLVWAADPRRDIRQRWACALLRVMHVMAHVQSPFEQRYGDAIREQIDGSFRPHVRRDERGLWLGADDTVPLCAFEVRPAKSPRSAAMKLLHKSEDAAAELFDRIGVRFVTTTRFDALLVVRYLRQHQVIAFANIKPSRSQNSLVDLQQLRHEMEALGAQRAMGSITAGDELAHLRAKVLAEPPPALVGLAHNPHRSEFYRSIQFTTRRIIRVPETAAPGGVLRFFFPYEVQILDQESYVRTLGDGPAAHAAYKERQRESVRQRVLIGLDDLADAP